MDQLTHFNDEKRAQMVDVTEKNETKRIAVAESVLKMEPETLSRIKEGKIKKR